MTDLIEQAAARRAYNAGLGASEWEAFLTPEEALTLMRAARAENEALRLRLAEGEQIVAEGVAVFDRQKAEIARLERGLREILDHYDATRGIRNIASAALGE
jgi:hypothetical protein